MQMRVTKRGTPFVVPGGTWPDGTQLCPAAACGRRPTLLMQIRSTKGPLWAPQPTELLCNGRAAPGGEGIGTARPSQRHGNSGIRAQKYLFFCPFPGLQALCTKGSAPPAAPIAQ